MRTCEIIHIFLRDEGFVPSSFAMREVQRAQTESREESKEEEKESAALWGRTVERD